MSLMLNFILKRNFPESLGNRLLWGLSFRKKGMTGKQLKKVIDENYDEEKELQSAENLEKYSLEK